MKVLLDGCVPERLRLHIPEHEVRSTRYAGFSGRKNGKLLRMVCKAGYEVLVTVDQELPFQQSSSVQGMADGISRALETVRAGQVMKLDYLTA